MKLLTGFHINHSWAFLHRHWVAFRVFLEQNNDVLYKNWQQHRSHVGKQNEKKQNKKQKQNEQTRTNENIVDSYTVFDL
jgi:hypothetical protein